MGRGLYENPRRVLGHGLADILFVKQNIDDVIC